MIKFICGSRLDLSHTQLLYLYREQSSRNRCYTESVKPPTIIHLFPLPLPRYLITNSSWCFCAIHDNLRTSCVCVCVFFSLHSSVFCLLLPTHRDNCTCRILSRNSIMWQSFTDRNYSRVNLKYLLNIIFVEKVKTIKVELLTLYLILDTRSSATTENRWNKNLNKLQYDE